MSPLKKLFGSSDENLDKLPAELRGILDEMRQERAAFEAARSDAESTLTQGRHVQEAVDRAQEGIDAIAARMTQLEGTASRLTELEQKAAALDEGHHGVVEQFDASQRQTEEAVAKLRDLEESLTDLRAFMDELPQLRELAGLLSDWRAQTDALDGQLRDASERLNQLRPEHDRLAVAADETHTDLSKIEERHEALAADLARMEERFESFTTTADQLQKLAKGLPNVKRELGTLNTLAEYTSQKVTTLEGQKEAVERAAKRAERLAELVNKVDRQLQEQHTNSMFLDRLQANVDELKTLHENVLERTEELRAEHRATEEEDRARHAEFVALRDEVNKAVSQIRFEREGLDSINERIV
ncbi:MAG: hypothetical protein PVF27_07455, partial [Gemmatimonadales bacterium]